MEYAYYTEKAEKITEKEKFLQIYEKEYFHRNCRASNEELSEKDIASEDYIVEILNDSSNLSREDVDAILRWKTFKYHYNQIDVDSVYEIVKDRNRSEFSGPLKDDCVSKKEQVECIELLDSLTSLKGMGIVYALTILYFLSNGRYPIYDRFASVAIDAIVGKKDINDEIEYCELSSSNRKAFTLDYKNYYKKIYEVFGMEYLDRKIDRALWAYGHFFTIKKVGRSTLLS